MQDLKPPELGKMLIQCAQDYDMKNMRKILDLKISFPDCLTPEVVNFRNSGSNTALHMAAQNTREKETIATFAHLVQLPGIDINAVNKQGATALIICAKKGYAEAVAFLLREAGAEFEIYDKEYGKCAIDYAGNAATKQELQRAIDARAAAARLAVVQAKSKDLHVALMEVLNDTTQAVELFKLQRLVSTMAPVDVLDYPNEEGQTPMLLAIARNRADIVQMLIAGGADPTCLDEVCLMQWLLVVWAVTAFYLVLCRKETHY
jgi:ankyrin repeat protein